MTWEEQVAMVAGECMCQTATAANALFTCDGKVADAIALLTLTNQRREM